MKPKLKYLYKTDDQTTHILSGFYLITKQIIDIEYKLYFITEIFQKSQVLKEHGFVNEQKFGLVLYKYKQIWKLWHSLKINVF